jgi:hypothetical protein
MNTPQIAEALPTSTSRANLGDSEPNSHREPMGTQVRLVADTVPNVFFRLFRNLNQTALALSPFRLGDQPNIRIGIAKVTAAEERVRSYERLAEDLSRSSTSCE